ncbi:hypothetical protein [Paenibacillus massiliensis]|uniref:hypothetical protein n=1 Tax=Paenibacillus massiliensis TaxID=225917 RepID=UPI0012B5D4E3|nr:hypothetical protein [Paenibacillus massiliensis]
MSERWLIKDMIPAISGVNNSIYEKTKEPGAPVLFRQYLILATASYYSNLAAYSYISAPA